MNRSVATTLLVLFCSTIRLGYSLTTQTKFDFEIIFNGTGVNAKDDVRFFLYTRINPEEPQQLWVDDKSTIEQSAYNSSKATKFMTHGWENTYQGMNCITVRKAFLAHDDYNVIVVDWGNIAKLPYLLAVARIKAVGAHIARMISFLESQGSDPNNMSLVGHSLGAHVMGLAGYQATNKVSHVVGLDPAGPGFRTAGPGRGISPLDAKYVEVIHTAIAIDLGLGRPAGHADFYPNGGGPNQPGCGADPKRYCAHDRAYVYFAEALTRPDYWYAVSCPSYKALLNGTCSGTNANPVPFPRWSAEGKEGVRGIFFLRTNDMAPFGLGLAGTKPVEEVEE